MAGKLKLLGVESNPDGLVRGTFDYLRDGRPTCRFVQAFPANADAAEISKTLVARCAQIVLNEPAPALSTIEQMFAGGEPRAIPDAPAA